VSTFQVRQPAENSQLFYRTQIHTSLYLLIWLQNIALNWFIKRRSFVTREMEVRTAGILEDTRGTSTPVTGGITAVLQGTAGQTHSVKPDVAGQNCSLFWSPNTLRGYILNGSRFFVYGMHSTLTSALPF